MRRPSPQAPTRRGLTMLEMMLAVTIFTLVSVVLLAVFRTGLRAYDVTYRETEVIQRARYVMDTLERDIMSLFYLDETEYNQGIRRLIEETANQFADENFEPPDREDFEDPYERGILIDLAIVGEDRGGQDALTFVAHEPFQLGGRTNFWGLSRINYSLDQDHLIRSVEDVHVPRIDFYTGEELEKVDAAEHTIVSAGVIEFDLSYAFWWDHQWYETDAWNSSDQGLRNATQLRGEYPETDFGRRPDIDPTGAERPNQQTQDGVTDFRELARRGFNGVPSYIRLRIVLEDPANPGAPLEMARIFRVPKSQETWTPNREIDDDMREEEQFIRDREYRRITPGALRRR